jgi:hypothetical protein
VNKNQQAQALISLYLSLHEKIYQFSPTINRYRIKWGMVDVIDSVGYERARELLAYYFQCESSHTVETFLNSFDKLDAMLVESEKDAEKRRLLREETRRRMNLEQ